MKPPNPLWWLDRRAYPYASRYRDTGAGRMHYIDEGEGEAVVFVHGVPTWSFNYRHLIRSLLPQYRCIAMDHLGFGLSDKPSGWSYAPEALAAHLEELIGGLGLKDITLVVHDWGGPLGLSYALQYPENVRRLVLFNSWMWPNEGLRARLTARLLASPLYHVLEDRWGITARLFIPLAMAKRQALTPEVHRHYLEPLRNRADRQGCWALVRAIHHIGGDAEYLTVFREIVFPTIKRFEPEWVLVSAGFDPHRRDPLGGMAVTEEGFAGMAQLLLEIAAEYARGRIAFLLEGGYDLAGLQRSVTAVLKTMRITARSDNLSSGATCKIDPLIRRIQEVHEKYR
jgi:pimeloyl-ACP methyl ester carboxylesterase